MITQIGPAGRPREADAARWRAPGRIGRWLGGILALCAAGALLLSAGCGGGDGGGGQLPASLELLADGFLRPNFVTAAGDGTHRLFVVEQQGTIRIIRDGQVVATPFLDITGLVRLGGERGMTGLAFHPDYTANGRFFVYFTTERNGRLQSVVSEFRVSQADPDRADPASERVLLVQDQPHENHNAGMLAFRPGEVRANLYIALGDGGAGASQNAQDTSNLLGSILRIDVDSGSPYAIASDNPFVADPDARDEIYAYGFRNPFRFSFDRANGRMLVADVGQEDWEEIDLVVAGGNYGWPIMEGTHCFNPPLGCDQTGLELPIHEYGHGLGCSVTGGYVYRGSARPAARGTYYLADFCSGRIWALNGSGSNWSATQVADTDLRITSFGEDWNAELLVVDLNGGVYRFLPG
ncbi:MAG: sorbosone dehydrogenase family protein [Armatimonadota bacterium]